MINIGIVGAAGYSGLELIKLLVNHPEANIVKLFGHSSIGNKIEAMHPSLRGIISHVIEKYDENTLDNVDLLFVALPSGQSMEVIKTAINKGKRVIDLGGDFRINDTTVYTKYYKHEHTAAELLSKSVYGLSEWNQKEISNAQLLANPGCYPTSVLLALLPVLKAGDIKEDFISVTSYSGTSGAGKSVNAGMMFSEVNESVKAYKAGNHQHIPEIRQYLKSFSGKDASFTFIPHLLPITRGIYTTIHTKIKNEISGKEVSEIFLNKYSQEKFVRFLGEELPEVKNVQNTNFCDIGFSLFDENLILFSAIDNLVKGAAGQAVQNMNIMYNISQETGLLLWNKNQW